MQVRYEIFRGRLTTWEDLFRQAAVFASKIGKENLIGISHSCDQNDGVVTVWYWEEKETNILGLKKTG